MNKDAIRAELSKLSTMEIAIMSVTMGGKSKSLVSVKDMNFYRRVSHLFTENDGESLSPFAKEEFDILKESRTAKNWQAAASFSVGDRVRVNPLVLGEDRLDLGSKIGVIVSTVTGSLSYANVRFFNEEGVITMSICFADLELFEKHIPV